MKAKSNIVNKKAIYSLSMILMLTMTLMMALAQSSLGQVGIPQPVKTVGYISVAPTLVGVGQEATVNLWVFPLPTNYMYLGYYDGYRGVTVTFVKPDGSTDTFMPVDGTGLYDAGQVTSLGSMYFLYKPDMAGNWSVSFTMPDQNLTDSTGTVLYTGCNSNTFYFNVQTEPVLAGLLNGYPWSPLPNDNVYWSYPINSNNREWSQISGDWLGSDMNGPVVSGVTCRLWQPYGSGPETGHIVWKQPYKEGGIIGGDYGGLSYTMAISRPSSIIMQGRVFLNVPNTNQFEGIDLATGQILYKASGQISVGLHLPGNPYAQSSFDESVVLPSSYGSTPTAYLFGTTGTTWNYYNPFTGNLMMAFANSTARSYKLVDGTNFAYGTTTDGKLFGWDISNVTVTSSLTGVSTITGDWKKGVVWTCPLPIPLNPRDLSIFGMSTDGSIIVLRNNPNQYWGYSAKDGTPLWNLTLTYPALYNEEMTLYGVDDFFVFDPVETTFKCYSMITGGLLWTSPSYKNSPWATTWTVYGAETNDYENLYLMFEDGTISALNLATGKEVWRSQAIPSTEFPNNAVPFVCGMVMVGGNIYAYGGYSIGYQINPMPRQSTLVCVNATTGDITFTLNGGTLPMGAANGYVLAQGMFDGNVYSIGKGQTSTTVTASPKVGIAGSSVLVEGTVMDQSPASLNTPAVADESMSEWMDYLHMQNATLLNDPPKPDGVTVRLAAVDPNGNVVDLGTVTSDSAGMYKKIWTPELEGEYTVYATFDGSNSYWGSYAQTALGVTEAPAASTSEQTQTQTDNSALLYGILVAVIIAIIISLLALFKKR